MEETLDYESSLRVISEMVQKTRRTLGGSFFYLLWGWLALSAAAIEYVLLEFMQSELHPIVWPVMGIIGGLVSVLYSRKSSKEKGHTSFVDKSMSYVWIAFGVMMVLSLIIGGMVSWTIGYALVIATYGTATFVSGGLLRFKPLIIGGAASWLIATACLLGGDYFSDFSVMLLMLMLSLVVSYLLPGYALRNAEK